MGRDQGVRAVAVPAVAAGNTTPVIGSACRLYGWSLADAGAGVASATAAAAAAAAGNATATLPVGAAITGFDVTLGQAASANVCTVTVNGAAGGTLTYTITVEGTGSATVPLVIRFPQPIAPANPAVAISVTFTGNVNSPAASVDVYGQTFQTVGQLLDGGQILGVSSPVAGASDTQWLADKGIYIGSGVSVKALSGSITGCIYVMDGTEIPAEAM